MKRALSPGLFVTGTDTGVGKTQVGAAVASLLRERGIVVQPRKPVESGCKRIDDRLLPHDALTLRTAAGLNLPLETICPHAFEPALSPERAAMLSSAGLTLQDLVQACRTGVGADDFLLVEGAGGFYSPIAAGALNADLASALGLPVLLVAADRLGVINHTLLTVEAIERRGLTLAAIVLNRAEPLSDPEMDNAADLSRWLGRPPIVTEHGTSGATGDGWRALRPALTALAASL
ncbi:dethiobiotin synthase [Methylotetracoccus oryzae]|uniref:dethiobiotin synthase n=1 Tax=Methylotetracoccus oryzae TaxID=1919059 RepID=UPI00111A92ED|nr:dethiobiotin synthase [Methylotetracoccus oryzae]